MFLNARFEVVGATPGEAHDWTVVILATGDLIADFSGGGSVPVSVESFDVGWQTADVWVGEVSGGILATFDVAASPSGTPYESFGYWLGNQFYDYVITGGIEALFGPGLDPADEFESGWGNDTYVTSVPDGGPTFTENFTPSTPWEATPTPGATATFYQGAQQVESYSPYFADVVFVVSDTATDICTAVNPATGLPVTHLFGIDQRLTLRTTGRLPAGTSPSVAYYALPVTPQTFKLQQSPGGAIVDLQDLGVGEHRAHADETLNWTNS